MSGRDTQAIKAALVLQGGGARGAFTSGVLDVFMEHGLDFPYVIGTSAGALCACNYISGDKGRNRFVCTELLTDPKFVSVRNLLFKRTAFNFNYLFFTVPKDIYPFSEEKFFKDERPFFAACTSMKTGEAIYFDKRKMDPKDFYTALSASASLPLLAKPVNVAGEKCLDGGPAAAVPFHKPFEDGYEKAVVILTRARGYRKQPLKSLNYRLGKALYRKYPAFLAKFKAGPDVYNADMDELARLEAEGKVFIIQPDGAPHIAVAEKDTEKLVALYEEGKAVAERLLPKLRKYLGVADE